MTQLSGWIIIDKPLGLTSADVVHRLRRLLRQKKIGHAGTLDPLATGLLPIALGEATKTVAYASNKDKRYIFEITFGEQRATDDAEGEIVATSEKLPSFEEIEATLPQFLGEIEQVPPDFSAISIDGKRAYQTAREGKKPELKARKVTIYEISLNSMPSPNKVILEVHCSKGTYVRSLARDLALSLGSVGYVSALRRTSVGAFLETSAISLEKLEDLVYKSATLEAILPVEAVLDDILVLALNTSQAEKVRCGQLLPLADFVGSFANQSLVQLYCETKLVALAKIEEENVRTLRVFNL